VLVGAGIGGLTSAALLADAGLRVQVFDHQVVPGGYCHTYLRKPIFARRNIGENLCCIDLMPARMIFPAHGRAVRLPAFSGDWALPSACNGAVSITATIWRG